MDGRRHKVIVLGIIILTLGFIMILEPPTIVQSMQEWTLVNLTLLDEKVMIKPKKEMVVEIPVLLNKTVTVPPLWKREEKPWFSEKVEVPWYSEYKYFSKILSTWRSKNLTVVGTAIEQSSKPFNFYILDTDNFLAWLGRKEYKFWFKGEGKPYYSFNISFAPPSSYYFVVEKTVRGLSATEMYERQEELIVNITVKSNYLRWYCEQVFLNLPFERPYDDLDSVYFNCTIQEEQGRKFDVYYMNSYIFEEKLMKGESYSTFFEAKGVSHVKFNKTIYYNQVKGLYGPVNPDFFFLNPYSQENLTVRILVTSPRIYEKENPALVYSKLFTVKPSLSQSSNPRRNLGLIVLLENLFEVQLCILNDENYQRLLNGVSYRCTVLEDFIPMLSNKTYILPALKDDGSLETYHIIVINPFTPLLNNTVRVKTILTWEEQIIKDVPYKIWFLGPIVIIIGSIILLKSKRMTPTRASA
ncbi:MAG: hypothetical protein QW491_13100 [Thermoproteota archaeon]|nr:hypothetical protein [Candidatus Brockarchaeota archaeon]